MFVGHGRAVAEGGMEPRRVVPAFDEAEAGDFRLGLRGKAMAFQQLAFESGEEAFAHRVVIGVADRSHRRPHAGFLAAFAECQRRILAALVAVMDDAVRPRWPIAISSASSTRSVRR